MFLYRDFLKIITNQSIKWNFLNFLVEKISNLTGTHFLILTSLRSGEECNMIGSANENLRLEIKIAIYLHKTNCILLKHDKNQNQFSIMKTNNGFSSLVLSDCLSWLGPATWWHIVSTIYRAVGVAEGWERGEMSRPTISNLWIIFYFWFMTMVITVLVTALSGMSWPKASITQVNWASNTATLWWDWMHSAIQTLQ